MSTRYAPDDLIRFLQNSRSNAAQYVYQHSEVKDDYFAGREMEWMLDALQGTLSIRGILLFAFAASRQPFQITIAAPDVFVLLMDRRAILYLLTLCVRLQSTNPLCKFLDHPEIEDANIYKEKTLLDITKHIVFHTKDVSEILKDTQSDIVYCAALLYVVAHEIAHAAHGHLDFKLSPAFKDFATNKEDEHLTNRALEMDADCSATTSVFDIFERLYTLGVSNGIELHDVSAEEHVQNFRRKYVTGVMFAHIFQDTLTLNFFPKSHPIGYVRLLTSIEVFKIVFSTRIPSEVELPELCRKWIVATFVELSGHLKFLQYPMAANMTVWEGDEDPVHLYDTLGVASGLEHLSLPKRRWSRLRPHLERYLRGGALAPAGADPY